MNPTKQANNAFYRGNQFTRKDPFLRHLRSVFTAGAFLGKRQRNQVVQSPGLPWSCLDSMQAGVLEPPLPNPPAKGGQ